MKSKRVISPRRRALSPSLTEIQVVNALMHADDLTREQKAFIVRAVNMHTALVRELKIAGEFLKKYHEDAGDCDHSVNVCVCDIVAAREDLERVLGRL